MEEVTIICAVIPSPSAQQHDQLGSVYVLVYYLPRLTHYVKAVIYYVPSCGATGLYHAYK